MMPEWVIVVMTGLAMCAAVLGQWRRALWLSLPAILGFLVWPLLWHYVSTVPPLLLIVIGLIALPFLLLRAIHRMLSMAISRRASDEAIGGYLSFLMISATRKAGKRRRRKRH